MEIHVHLHNHADREVTNKLDVIIKKINTMADTIQGLTEQVAELRSALTEEKAQILEVISKLQATIDEHQAGNLGGGTPAERQALSDEIASIIVELKGIVPDPEEPQE